MVAFPAKSPNTCCDHRFVYVRLVIFEVDGHDGRYSRHFAQTAKGDGRQSRPRVSHDLLRGGLRLGRIPAMGPRGESTRVIVSLARGRAGTGLEPGAATGRAAPREAPSGPTAGLATVEAIRPVLEDWLERRHGSLSFRVTQVLPGHGCFGKYLCRIDREPKRKGEGDLGPLPRPQKANRAQENGRQRPFSAPINGSRGEGLGEVLAPYSIDPCRRRARVSARASETMHGLAQHLTNPRRRRGPDRPGQR